MKVNEMTPEMINEVKLLTTPDEKKAFAKAHSIQLSEEQLNSISGGSARDEGQCWFFHSLTPITVYDIEGVQRVVEASGDKYELADDVKEDLRNYEINGIVPSKRYSYQYCGDCSWSFIKTYSD